MTAAASTIGVTLNSGAVSLPDATTIADVIERLAVRGRYAVEINGMIVPRSSHSSHTLKHGDRVEVVAAIGGG